MKNRVDTVLEFVLMFLLSFMLMNVLWQVLSRYILQSPSTITDELSRFLLIWLGLLGAAYATGKHLHLAIDLLPKRLTEQHPTVTSSVIHVAILVFSLSVLVIGGCRLCWITFILEQRSATLKIPLAIVYIVIPISGLLIVYYSTLQLLKSNHT